METMSSLKFTFRNIDIGNVGTADYFLGTIKLASHLKL